MGSKGADLEESIESEYCFGNFTHVGVTITITSTSNCSLVWIWGSVSSSNFISNNVMQHNEGPLAKVLEICVPFVRPEISEQINTNSTHGKTDCVKAVLVPNDERSL